MSMIGKHAVFLLVIELEALLLDTKMIKKNNHTEVVLSFPRYMTVDINGDIVTSEWYYGIILIDQAGHHRFSYNLSTPCTVVTD